MDERERNRLLVEASALIALARREHSCHELQQKFRGRFDAELVTELIESLTGEGLLSDERFAQMLCRSRFSRGVGPVRIQYELDQHRIRSEWIEQAMAEYDDLWVEQLRSLRQRKYGDTPPVDYTAWARQARFFQGKGFTSEQIHIKLHGHCQQKAVASTGPVHKILSIPENYRVEEIPSGCCGMAGSFGYEREHYDLSMKVGELVLFPAVRASGKETVIAAPGTSCRHQIKDGTGVTAYHPLEILYRALN